MVKELQTLKILVPLDGSNPSVNALAKAVDLLTPQYRSSNKKQTEVILLYVVPRIEVPLPLEESEMMVEESTEIREYIKELYFSFKENAFTMLQDIAKKFIKDNDLFTIRIKVMYGNPTEEIVECAHKEKVDVIVMGNIGLGGFSRLKALGSISRNVSERVRVPVMIVPYPE
jgi:nucleotide-binding universal stress UspA family protein